MTSFAISAVNQNWIHSNWITKDSLMDMRTVTIH